MDFSALLIVCRADVIGWKAAFHVCMYLSFFLSFFLSLVVS